MLMRIIIIGLVLATTGCQLAPRAQGHAKPSQVGSALNATPQPAQDTTSGLVPVQRKRAQLIRDTLAKALKVPKQALCNELNRIPCIDMVHRVSLGGVAAYRNSQYHYPKEIAITSPISFERVVLSACTFRAGNDFKTPEAGVIFKDIETTIDGRLVDNKAIDEAITRLYQRGLTRNPTAAEVAALRGLYQEIYDEEPNGAALNWMILTCFSVLSGIESAFY